MGLHMIVGQDGQERVDVLDLEIGVEQGMSREDRQVLQWIVIFSKFHVYVVWKCGALILLQKKQSNCIGHNKLDSLGLCEGSTLGL